MRVAIFRVVWLLSLAIAITVPAACAQEPVPAAYDSPLLSSSEKDDLRLVRQMRAQLGDEVWPGFGSARIPILLYNDAYDFLAGAATAPEGWEAAAGDDFDGEKYFRRKSIRPTGFAVKVGEQWVGSLDCRTRMSEQMRAQMSLAVREDQYSVWLLHEMFHAFQAQASPKHFRRAQAVYADEKQYPYQNKEFAQSWNQEGAALAAALNAKDDAAAIESIKRFLSVRDARRRMPVFVPAALDFERELEWLEGLGKYAETRLYELAGKNAEFKAGARFGPSSFYWSDGSLLAGRLGEQRGDLRFYLSGSAQARLLDRLAPGWKARAFEDGVFLEDLLRKAIAASTAE